jgi:hypothetical protein
MLATYFPSTPSTPTSAPSSSITPSIAGVNYTPMTFTTNSAGQTAAVPKQTYTPMTVTTNAAGQTAVVPVSSGSSSPAPVAQTSSGGGSSSAPISPAPAAPVSGGGSSQLPELQAQLTDLQSKLAEAQKLGLAPTDTIPEAIMKGMTAEAYMTSDEYRKVQEQKDKVEAERKAAELKDLEYNNQIAILKKQIADVQAGVGQPKAPELLEKHKDLMTEHSMPTLAQDINDLKALQREMEASAREGRKKQEGRLAPMGLISTRQQELASRANEEMDFINRQIQTKVDEYNTKLSMIGMTMDLVKADYETSYKVYSDN